MGILDKVKNALGVGSSTVQSNSNQNSSIPTAGGGASTITGASKTNQAAASGHTVNAQSRESVAANQQWAQAEVQAGIANNTYDGVVKTSPGSSGSTPAHTQPVNDGWNPRTGGVTNPDLVNSKNPIIVDKLQRIAAMPDFNSFVAPNTYVDQSGQYRTLAEGAKADSSWTPVQQTNQNLKSYQARPEIRYGLGYEVSSDENTVAYVDPHNPTKTIIENGREVEVQNIITTKKGNVPSYATIVYDHTGALSTESVNRLGLNKPEGERESYVASESDRVNNEIDRLNSIRRGDTIVAGNSESIKKNQEFAESQSSWKPQFYLIYEDKVRQNQARDAQSRRERAAQDANMQFLVNNDPFYQATVAKLSNENVTAWTLENIPDLYTNSEGSIINRNTGKKIKFPWDQSDAIGSYAEFKDSDNFHKSPENLDDLSLAVRGSVNTYLTDHVVQRARHDPYGLAADVGLSLLLAYTGGAVIGGVTRGFAMASVSRGLLTPKAATMTLKGIDRLDDLFDYGISPALYSSGYQAGAWRNQLLQGNLNPTDWLTLDPERTKDGERNKLLSPAFLLGSVQYAAEEATLEKVIGKGFSDEFSKVQFKDHYAYHGGLAHEYTPNEVSKNLLSNDKWVYVPTDDGKKWVHGDSKSSQLDTQNNSGAVSDRFTGRVYVTDSDLAIQTMKSDLGNLPITLQADGEFLSFTPKQAQSLDIIESTGGRVLVSQAPGLSASETYDLKVASDQFVNENLKSFSDAVSSSKKGDQVYTQKRFNEFYQPNMHEGELRETLLSQELRSRGATDESVLGVQSNARFFENFDSSNYHLHAKRIDQSEYVDAFETIRSRRTDSAHDFDKRNQRSDIIHKSGDIDKATDLIIDGKRSLRKSERMLDLSRNDVSISPSMDLSLSSSMSISPSASLSIADISLSPMVTAGQISPSSSPSPTPSVTPSPSPSPTPSTSPSPSLSPSVTLTPSPSITISPPMFPQDDDNNNLKKMGAISTQSIKRRVIKVDDFMR